MRNRLETRQTLHCRGDKGAATGKAFSWWDNMLRMTILTDNDTYMVKVVMRWAPWGLEHYQPVTLPVGSTACLFVAHWLHPSVFMPRSGCNFTQRPCALPEVNYLAHNVYWHGLLPFFSECQKLHSHLHSFSCNPFIQLQQIRRKQTTALDIFATRQAIVSGLIKLELQYIKKPYEIF